MSLDLQTIVLRRRRGALALLLLVLAMVGCDESGEVGEVTPLELRVVIRNTGGSSVFIDAVGPGYIVTQGGAPLVLESICPCSQCGSRELCRVETSQPRVVRLPPGAELALVEEIVLWNEAPRTPEQCPETPADVGSCGEPVQAAVGTYGVVVAWDTQANIEAQGLMVEENRQRFGFESWGAPGSGSATLTQRVEVDVDLVLDAKAEAIVELP